MSRHPFIYRSGFRARAKGNAGNSGKHKGQAAGALDGLNPTAAYSVSRNLLSTFSGSKYTDAGAGAISSWTDQTGNSRDLTDAGTAGKRPTLSTAGPLSTACLDFNGTSNVLAKNAYAISNFVTNAAKYVVISFIVDTVTATDATNPYNNHGLWGDSGGFLGLYIRTGVTVEAYNFDGSNDKASTGSLSTATAYVVALRHDSGNLYLNVNGTETGATASGNTTNVTNDCSIAKVYGGSSVYFDGKIFELATFSTVPTSGQRSALITNFMNQIGAV